MPETCETKFGRALSIWLPFALIFCSLLSTARAESVVMLPSPKDSVATEAKLKTVQAGVVEGLASQNYHLRSDDIIEQKLLVRPDLRCDVREKSCAIALMAETTADLGCSVLVWRGSPKNVASRVTVFLVEKDGTHHFADAEIGTQDLSAAAKHASVAAVAARQSAVKTALSPNSSIVAASASPKMDDVDTEKPIVGPLILGGAGLVLTTVGIVSLLPGTCDSRATDSTCIEGSNPRPALGWTLVGVGAAAAVGAVLWYVIPRQSKQAPKTSVSVGPGSVAIQGTF